MSHRFSKRGSKGRRCTATQRQLAGRWLCSEAATTVPIYDPCVSPSEQTDLIFESYAFAIAARSLAAIGD